MRKKHIRVAYSSDSDDAFMYLALEEGRVADADYQFSFYRGDIQELNERALQQEYDVSAISIAMYPRLSSHYSLMTVGTSVAEQSGPVLIVAEDNSRLRAGVSADLQGATIALPGSDTTATLVCKEMLGNFHAKQMHFLHILPAVLAGEVDAGVLIHELQLACEGVRVVLDLAQLWRQRHALPLPLGGNVISKHLLQYEQEQVVEIIKQSIAFGLSQRHTTIKRALALAGADIGLERGDEYINRYVNATTLALDARAKQSIELMLGNSNITYVGQMAEH